MRLDDTSSVRRLPAYSTIVNDFRNKSNERSARSSHPFLQCRTDDRAVLHGWSKPTFLGKRPGFATNRVLMQ